jgi:hypothetical protein
MSSINFFEDILDHVGCGLAASHFLDLVSLLFLSIYRVFEVLVVVALFILDQPPRRGVHFFY